MLFSFHWNGWVFQRATIIIHIILNVIILILRISRRSLVVALISFDSSRKRFSKKVISRATLGVPGAWRIREFLTFSVIILSSQRFWLSFTTRFHFLFPAHCSLTGEFSQLNFSTPSTLNFHFWYQTTMSSLCRVGELSWEQINSTWNERKATET